MANEYKLSYTAAEIDEKLGQIDSLATTTSVSEQLSTKQDKITGTTGDFVVIGDDGNLTTKTILNASEVKF